MVAGLAVAALVGLAACGGDDDAGSDAAGVEASAPAVDGEVEADDAPGGADSDDPAATASGDDSVDTGGGDFPIPAPDGLVLDVLVDAGLDMEGQRQLLYDNDDFDRVVAFYDEWTSREGEWAQGESEGTVVLQRLDGAGIRSITIAPNHDPGAQAEGPVTLVLLVASG